MTRYGMPIIWCQIFEKTKTVKPIARAKYTNHATEMIARLSILTLNFDVRPQLGQVCLPNGDLKYLPQVNGNEWLQCGQVINRLVLAKI